MSVLISELANLAPRIHSELPMLETLEHWHNSSKEKEENPPLGMLFMDHNPNMLTDAWKKKLPTP